MKTTAIALFSVIALTLGYVTLTAEDEPTIFAGSFSIPPKQASLAIANPGQRDNKSVAIEHSNTQRLANYLITINDPDSKEILYRGYLHDLVNIYNQTIADIILLREQGRDTSALEAKAILYQTYQADIIADFQARGLEDFATSTTP